MAQADEQVVVTLVIRSDAKSAVDAQKALGEEAKKLGVTLEDVTHKVENQRSTYDKMMRALDPVYAGMKRLEGAEKALQAEVDRGRISLSQKAQALDLLKSKIDSAANSNLKMGQSVGGLRGAFDQFSAGLGVANRVLGIFGVALTVGAVIEWGKHVIEAVGNLGNLAEQLGVSTQSLQAYQFVAAQTGVDSEKLQGGIAKLTRSIGDAAEGNDVALKAFNKLGIGILDVNGKVRGTDAVMGDVARALAKIEDPTIKGAAAAEIFGSKIGQRLLPMLKELAEKGLPAFIKAQKDANAVAGDDLINRFDELSAAAARFGMKAVVVSAQFIGAMGDMASKSASLAERAFSPYVNWLERLWNLAGKVGDLTRGGMIGGRPGLTTVIPGSENWPKVPLAGVTPSGPSNDNGPTSNPLSEKDKAREESLRKYIAALEDEAKAVSKGNAERAIAAALRQAEDKLIDEQGKKVRDLTEAEIQQITISANAPLAHAAHQALVETNAQAEGQRRLVAAYGVSEAAGKTMEAQLKAEAEARKNTNVVVLDAAFAYRSEASAKALRDSQKDVTDLGAQAEAQRRLTAAAMQGVEASQEVMRQNAEDEKFRERLAVAIDRDKEAILDEKAAYDIRSKAILTDQQQIEQTTRLRDADNKITLAAAEAHGALLTNINDRQASTLAIARMQELNALVKQYGEGSAKVAENIGKFDVAAALSEQKRFWDDVRDLADSTSKDVKQFLLDGIVNAGKGGKSVFKDMWDTALAGGKRMIISLALEMARQKFILPVLMQVIGGAPSLFGIASPQGQAGANPLQIAGQVGQASQAVSFFSNPIGSISNLLSNFFSPTNAIASAFPSLFGAGGVTLGSAGFVGAEVAGAAGGITAGAAPLAGLAPFLPALAIALPLLLGFFLSRKETVGPNANAVINYQTDASGNLVNPGGLAIGGLGADNDGDTSIAQKMADAATKGVNSIVSRLGATMTGFPGAGDITQNQLYYFQKTGKYGSMVGGSKEEFSSAEEAVANFIRRALTHGTIEGMSDDVRLALSKSVASSIEDLGKDIDFANTFRRTVEMAIAGPGTKDAQALQFKYSAQDNAIVQRQGLKDYIDNARRLFGEDSTQFTEAKATARTRALQMIGLGPETTGANAPLEGMAAQVLATRETFQALKQTLIDTGLSAEEAQKSIDEGIRQTFRKIADDQEKAISDAIFSGTSPAGAAVKALAEAQKKRRDDYIAAHTAAGDTSVNLAGVYTLDRIEGGAAMIGMTKAQLDEIAVTMNNIGDASPGMYDALQQAYKFAEFMVNFGKMQVDIARWNYEAQQEQQTLADAKSTYIDVLNRELGAVNDQIQAQQQLASTFTNLSATMKATRLGLLIDPNLSPLNPRDRLTEARSQFESIYSRAQLGDTAAMEQLPGISRSFLEASKAFNASNSTYFADFSRVQEALSNTETIAERQARIANDQLTTLNGQKAILERMLREAQGQSENLMTVAEAAAAWKAAQPGSSGSATRGAQQKAAFDTLATDFNKLYSGAASQGERDQIYQAAASQRDALLGSITDIATLQSIGNQYYRGNSTDSGAIFLRSRLYSLGTPPTFAEGGYHMGGLRLVGERGPELEMTGPARYVSADATIDMLRRAGSAANDGALLAAVRTMCQLLAEGNGISREAARAMVQRLDDVIDGQHDNHGSLAEERARAA